MSKADELFDNLGYKKKHHIVEDEIILIGYTKFDEPVDECSIMFLKKAKRLMAMNWITINELQAINLKVKELRLDRRRR